MALDLVDLNAHKAAIDANTPGAIADYYDYLEANGIPYGELAGDVAGETGLYDNIAT